jgi:hypothetical protein
MGSFRRLGRHARQCGAWLLCAHAGHSPGAASFLKADEAYEARISLQRRGADLQVLGVDRYDAATRASTTSRLTTGARILFGASSVPSAAGGDNRFGTAMTATPNRFKFAIVS